MSARNDKADDLHLRLYYCARLVEMAALASETKRVLLDIEGALEHRPEMREALHNHVHRMQGWQEQADPTAECLGYIAIEMTQAADALLNLAYDRTRATAHFITHKFFFLLINDL